MVELWLVVEPQVNNTLYLAKEFFYSASFSVEGGAAPPLVPLVSVELLS